MKRIYIEITNICNLDCSFCIPTKRKKQSMSLDQFTNIVQQTKKITPYTYLHVQGEPLLHPEFEQILSICDENQLQIQLVTNGTYLALYPTLYKHPSLRKISFSLQSIEFQKEPIDIYLKQIESFINAVKSERPDLYIELRLWREEQMNHKRTQQVLSFLMQHFQFQPTTRKNSIRLDENIYLSYANSFEWPSGDNREACTNGTCLGTIQQIAILVDGSVVPCCLDANGAIVFGNIFETDLNTILQSTRYQAMKQGFEMNKVIEPFCQTCSYRQRFTK